MGGIKRFKNFEEANRDVFEGFYRRGFDSGRMREFFQEFSGRSKVPYKPGLYKFKSFEQAREYDREQYIKEAGGQNR